MNGPDLPRRFFVKSGDLLEAGPWGLLGKAVRRMKLISGWGIRLRWLPDGTIISVDNATTIFDHPWRTFRDANGVAFNWGQINGVNGTVGNVELEEGTHPTLRIDPTLVTVTGKCWVAAEITMFPETAEQNAFNIKSWRMVQVSGLQSDNGVVGSAPSGGTSDGGVIDLPGHRARQPIAMLRFNSDGNFDVYQITYFHLAHRFKTAVKEKPSDPVSGRHFFYPRG